MQIQKFKVEFGSERGKGMIVRGKNATTTPLGTLSICLTVI